MNYIWFNADKSIKKFNIGYLIQESSNVDELYIFTDDPQMDSLNCYVRFKRADSLVLGDFVCEYGSYTIDGSLRFGWRLTINTNVLKVAGQLGITAIFKQTISGVEFEYAQCYATTIVLKSVAIATQFELLMQQYLGNFQQKLTEGSNILINGTVISVKLANTLGNTDEVPSCDLVKRYVDDMNDGFFEGLGEVLDEINGDVSESKLETPVIYLNGNTLTFNLIDHATAYEVYSGVTKIVTITSSPYNLSNVITSTGTYSIKMKATADGYTDSEFSNIVTYVKANPTPQLDAPVIAVADNVISWSAIANATSYEIYKTVGGVDTKLATTNGTSWDFSDILADGTYTFYVIARADGYITSEDSNTVNYTKTTVITQYVVEFKLNSSGATGDPPSNLTVNAGTIVDLTQYNTGFSWTDHTFLGWNTDKNAEVGLNSITVNQNTTVWAIWSALPKLATPSGLAINGTQLSWNAVTHATSYKVFMNDVQIGTSTNAYFNFATYVTNAGTYYFQVQALATGYASSNLTSKSDNAKYIKTLPKMPKPTISISTGVVSWSAVSLTIDGLTYNANYQVFANGTAISGIISSTSYSLIGQFNESGTYAITVIAVGVTGMYQASDESNSVNYTYTAGTSYTVGFSRADSNNVTMPITVSYPGGSITLDGDDDSGSVQLNTTGVTFTIQFYGIAYGNLPIPPDEQYTNHSVGVGGTGSFTLGSWSTEDLDNDSPIIVGHDTTVTKVITVNGTSAIILSNQLTNEEPEE